LKILVTGSAGHLGEALVRTLRAQPAQVVGVDIRRTPFTDVVGSIADRAVVDECMRGVTHVLHAATLHKPHVATHARQAFVDTNLTGTLNLLEAATQAGVRAFVFTSTTSTFGDALTPPAGSPAAWITEEVAPIPKNIYGVTKTAAAPTSRPSGIDSESSAEPTSGSKRTTIGRRSTTAVREIESLTGASSRSRAKG
jgi:nucleoside-diphosphate-sugar epimerase